MNKFNKINEINIVYVQEKKTFGIGIIYDNENKRMVTSADDLKSTLKKIDKLCKQIEFKNKYNETTKD